MTVSQEMPDLPLTSPTPSTYGPTLTTTLPSGLKILTSPNASSLTVTYTTPFTPSPSSLPSRYMSFKSSSLASTLKTSRTFEDLGASTSTSHSRSSLTRSFTCDPTLYVHLLPHLAVSPVYEPWDVQSALKSANLDKEAAKTDPILTLQESIYSACYGESSPLGESIYGGCSAGDVVSFTEGLKGG
eukprot:CAMPEP_0182490222 /NCGR_PEP_ID=MMETSP1321-20130603/163_1 /TAXON_ID=91990 /ORGANISM="Bolidomonas sp., Strain RCC1657" /LENGTH=185 /DNA_ID=CAMNT_0024692369 /DNA_START=33 /DNA_END=586 /DNA_ORIENTATION=-